jgi:hypothetical protein
MYILRKKNLEYFIFRQVTDYAALNLTISRLAVADLQIICIYMKNI